MEKSSAGNVDAGKQLKGLAGLPAELLDAVLRQLDASSRLPVFRTSKLLATALLRVVPWIRLTYPTQSDISGQHLRELAPFLTEVLRNRKQPKLHLTLQPANGLTDAIQQRQRAEPAAAAADAARLLAWMLGAVPLCGAVDRLTISWRERPDLPWEPVFSAALATSFPSLTSLTFCGGMTNHQLAKAINHPLLVPRLLHLNLLDASITHQGDVGRSPFIGTRLQTLSLKEGDLTVLGGGVVTRHLRHRSGQISLPPHLTQLKVTCSYEDAGTGPSLTVWDWHTLAAAVRSLTQLQQLQLITKKGDTDMFSSGPLPLLRVLAHLPSLHTLVMGECVVGQEQLDALLALTQITRLGVAAFLGLTSSRASAACSWRWLTVEGLDWVSAAYLPLHSLTHPLRLHGIKLASKEPSKEVLAAAELNLCACNKAGLELDGVMYLSKAIVNQLTYLYLTHSRRIAQLPFQPTVASSSHSGPSTSLASSSSPEGHITPGGPGSSSGQGVSAAGGQALMQRLGQYVETLYISVRGLSGVILSEANQHALAVLFPKAGIRFYE